MITLYDSLGRVLTGFGPHEATHVSGGDDAFLSTDLLEAVVKRIRETSGPATLLVGGVGDGQILQRSGTNLVGAGTAGEVEALAGTSGTPSSANKFVTDADARNANARTPTAHEATHASGGTDPFLSTDLLEALVKRLQESAGPTPLTIGSVPDGTAVKRSGTTLVGAVIGVQPSMPVNARTSAYTVDLTDFGKVVHVTSGTFALALTAAATLGTGFFFGVKNGGAGVVTVDPASAEQIDGAATLALNAGDECLVFCDGANFFTVSHSVKAGTSANQLVRLDGSAKLPAVDASQLTSVPVTAHEATHKSGGSDAFLSTDVLEAIVKRVQESGGPTTLALGAVADGSLFSRNGSSVVGVAGVPLVLTNKTGVSLATGDVVAIDSANASAVALADTASTQKQLVVSLDAPANNAVGRFMAAGVAAVNVTGAVVKGNYVVKSVTTLVAKDSGTAAADATAPPAGSFGIALTTATGNVITALLFGVTLSASGGGGSSPPTVQVITATGDWTKPAGLTAAIIEIVAGGGGGAGGAAGDGGGGGGGGGYSRKRVAAASLGSTETVTIGAAGAAGSAAGNGGAGGTTSFGTHCSATGGAGGAHGSNGGLGGVGSSGDVNADGGGGNASVGNLSPGKNGGGSFFSGGALGPNTGNGTAGKLGAGGGGGGGNAATGGAGGAGVCVVTEFY